MKNITTVLQNMHQKEVISKLLWKIKYYSIAYIFMVTFKTINVKSNTTFQSNVFQLFTTIRTTERIERTYGFVFVMNISFSKYLQFTSENLADP